MKKMIVLAGIAAMLIVSSCTPEQTPVETYYVKCKLDGVTYNTTSIVYTNHLNSPYQNTIVAGDSVNNQYIAFNLRDTTDVPIVKNYTLNASHPEIMLGMQASPGGSYSTANGAGSGSLNFTEVTSDKVKGTFSGTIYSGLPTPKVITEGEFNVQRN